MAFALDTLEFARHLKKHGVPDEQAEAHAEAARTFLRTFFMAELVTKSDLQLALEHQTLKLTIRLGGLLVAGIGALALLQQL